MATVHGTNGPDFIHVSGDGHTPPVGYTNIPLATNSADTILPGPGDDIIYAGNGNDTIDYKTFFNAADQVDGGGGTDTVVETGTTNANITITNMTSVEIFDMEGSMGNFTLASGVAPGGTSFTVNANRADTDANLTFSGINCAGNFIFNGGTVTSEIFIGGSGADRFNIKTVPTGTLILNGEGGADTIIVGGNLGAIGTFVSIDGGSSGSGDLLDLTGPLSAPAASTFELRDLQEIRLHHGNDYTLEITNLVFDPLTGITVVNGKTLGSGDVIALTADAGLTGSLTVNGGDGADNLTLEGSVAAATLNGGGGNDTVTVANLTNVIIDGGTGTADTLILSGDYTLTFNPVAIANIDVVTLAAGHDYTLSATNSFVAAGHTFTVNGAALGSGDVLSFDGSAETNGHLALTGGAGADVLTGGAQNDSFTGGDGADTFNLDSGGNDTAVGGNGNDVFNMGAKLNASDRIDGGSGSDTINLDGNYATRTILNASTFANVETMHFAAGNNYWLVINGPNVGSGQTLTVDGSGLGSGNTLQFHVRDATSGHLVITGGDGNDNLSGGTTQNIITGGLGADTMQGGFHDQFDYAGVSDSTSTTHDLLQSYLSGAGDTIHLPFVPTAFLGLVIGGSISSATFDANLVTVANAGALPVGDAAVFKPTSGTLSGHFYLVVDANGVAGYQAGADYVIEMDASSSTGSVTFV